MHLISSLAAGARGGENGFVDLLLRGTSTPATYYSDFEATQQHPGTAVPLDSNGRLIAYVAELVDVKVHDANGVFVCDFVAGVEDAVVEVISPSFTGTDYTSGARGTQKPTNLAAVLDAWLASAGAPDFKVLFGGAATNLQSAFALTFFNVKNYGAVGNGVADDGTAITTAQTAASAVGGGTVFFPPGTYRITSAITLAANVLWLGSGGKSSRLAVDSGASVGALVLPGNAAGSISAVSQLWINSINGLNPGTYIVYSAVTSGEFHFTDCVFGDDARSEAIYAGIGGTSALKTVFTRCYFKISFSSSQILINTGTARLIVRDCDLINANAVGAIMVDCPTNGVFENNRFDWSAAGAGPGIKYLQIAPTANGSVTVVGNQFVANTAMACVAIHNTLATPNSDATEYGNMFGNMTAEPSGCTPYSYVTDGYAPLNAVVTSGHQTRNARTECWAAVAAATLAVDPKAKGTTTIMRTGGGNLTVNANKGSLGDRWVLHVNNSTGGAITVAAGTNIIFDPTAAPLAINNLGFAEVALAWLPTSGALGFWYQVAKAVLS